MQDKQQKNISLIYSPPITPQGDGARVARIIGSSKLRTLDPFLMLDSFSSKLPAGFPDHPHRGFQTVTYATKGKMLHQDFRGHKGELNAGDVQWMTAGRGIVHAEMPGSFEEESSGFQLWINLDKKNKMCEPQYQEFKSHQMSIYDSPEMNVQVIAGQCILDGKVVKGVVEARTPAHYFDVRLRNNESVFEHIVPAGWNSLIVCYEGSLDVGGKEIKSLLSIVFERNKDNNQVLKVKAGTKAGAKFLVIAGKPIQEKIAWHGPFVMNEDQEIMQAINDYQNATNGFQGADSWNSQIRNLKKKDFKIEDL